jgi:hypothetical protein
MNHGYKILQHRTKNLCTEDQGMMSEPVTMIKINFRSMEDSLMDPEYVNYFPSLYVVKHYIVTNI